MSRRPLDAAGITDPALREAFWQCRNLNARHGRSYYLATRLLPIAKRPWVHALYGFARKADDIVDASPDPGALIVFVEQVRRDLAAGSSQDMVTSALLHTMERWEIPVAHVEAFLHSMCMDLTISSYASFEDLMVYVEGSAAVIGLQMLPILEPVVAPQIAAPYARDLGIAFQLTNFLRDVGEDLRRGRVYLPQQDLDLFGVDLKVLDGSFRQLMAFQVARTRELYRSASWGVRLLDPSSRPCINTALRLYGAILDEIERADYDVLHRRVSVGVARRVALAGPALMATAAPRRPTNSGSAGPG